MHICSCNFLNLSVKIHFLPPYLLPHQTARWCFCLWPPTLAGSPLWSGRHHTSTSWSRVHLTTWSSCGTLEGLWCMKFIHFYFKKVCVSEGINLGWHGYFFEKCISLNLWKEIPVHIDGFLKIILFTCQHMCRLSGNVNHTKPRGGDIT